MTAAIMGLPQTSIGTVGPTVGGFVLDNRFGNMYGVDIGDGAISGIRKWDIWPQGQERLARNLASLSVTFLYFYNTVTYRSQELLISNGVSNSAAISGFALGNLNHTSDFGINNADGSNSGKTRILASGGLCSFVNRFGRDVVVSATLVDGTTTGGQELNTIYWPTVNQKLNIVDKFAAIGSKPDGSGSEAWAFGYGLSTSNMHLYRIDSGVGGSSVTQIGGNITPATIDPTWSHVTAVFGITVDQTDGNLILGFNTTDAVTNRARFVKFNRTTGAKMWSVQVGGNPSGILYDTTDMAKNVIKNGVLYYLGSDSNSLWTINTITGTAVSSTLSDVTLDPLHGHQVSEDVSGTATTAGVTTVAGSVMWYGAWSEGTTHPAYLGKYCLTDGNHSGSAMGWRCWPTVAVPNPAPSYAAPAYSRKRAWSFDLDGHTFYCLDLGGQGCYLYDNTTNQWCQFITQGYVTWNFANGCMWGQRIVAGDLVTTDIWEMQPGSSFFDNGATEIIHTVTGGVATRNRVYHSVDAFTLACSNNLLQDVAGASVVLAFSDDAGKTWTTMPTITLTQGPPYTTTVEWRSLGAFTAPGRIFSITDTGGFLRIDGADAGIGSFDDPAPTIDSG